MDFIYIYKSGSRISAALTREEIKHFIKARKTIRASTLLIRLMFIKIKIRKEKEVAGRRRKEKEGDDRRRKATKGDEKKHKKKIKRSIKIKG